MKYNRAVRNRKPGDEFEVDDPAFGDFVPEFYKSEEAKNSNGLHPELRKLVYNTLPEDVDPDFPIENKEDALLFETYHDAAINYFKAKTQFFDDAFENQLQLTTEHFAEMEDNIRLEDERMEAKLDFMYNYLDFDSDRDRVRGKFLREMNKKTSLQDIGEVLDELVLEEKAKNWQHYKLHEHHNAQPARASEDYTTEDFKWSGKMLSSLDAKAPHFIDDPRQLHQQHETARERYSDVYHAIRYADERRDHSEGALTQEERNEVALFHSMKQDPYYKHYLYNHLRKYAEDEDEVNLGFPGHSIEKKDLYDHAKFDKLNLFDFRRNLPMKEREARIDAKMRAHGYGKRKKARCLARVEPGSGRVTVNGKPLLQSMFLPMQRQRILTPLSVTHYTCLLDVNLRVWGGGYNGQVEAIIPALAKAIQGFDTNTRRTLKFFGLTKHDGRNKERKKIGKQKARKGNVYRRR